MARRREAAARQPVRLPVIGGGGLQPGVDLDDNARLLKLLEGERDERLRSGPPAGVQPQSSLEDAPDVGSPAGDS